MLQKEILVGAACVIFCVVHATALHSRTSAQLPLENDISSFISGMIERMEYMSLEIAKMGSEMEEMKSQRDAVLQEALHNITIMEGKYEALQQAVPSITAMEQRDEMLQEALRNITVIGDKDEVLHEALRNITVMQDELRQCKDVKISHLRGRFSNSDLRPARHAAVEQIMPVEEMTDISNLVKLFVPRSCLHWRHLGFTTTGHYLIDPDGHGVGEKPVPAYCDMLTGYTFIGHDTEDSHDVPECSGAGCHTVSVNYNASMAQIDALIYNSEHCNQYIKVECNNSPLINSSNTPLTWWEDRNGQEHTYWSGSMDGQHVCRCGLSGTCVRPDLNCNCDAGLQDVWLYDEGTLSNMSSLPVTKINLGMDPKLSNSKMRIQLGPFRCYGSKHHMHPSSCEELRLSGVHRSGYYFLGTPDNVTLTYCKLTTEEGVPQSEDLQILSMVQELGRQDPKASVKHEELTNRIQALQDYIDSEIGELRHTPVIFHAHSTKDVESEDIVVFNDVQLDTHDAYNHETGQFVVPKDGKYLITFYSERRPTSSHAMVRLKMNDNDIAYTRGDTETEYSTFGFSTIKSLEKGDKLHIYLSGAMYGCSYGCNGFSIVSLT